ncbi:MAG: CapA family protein [Synergistaceae bacterium]|nr:CapA family protein [Synergistaceae bacterium]
MKRMRLTLIWVVLCGLILCPSLTSGAEPRFRAVFVGDIMAHREQLDGARRGKGVWDFKPQFRRVKPLFSDALAVGNLETVFAGEKSGFAGYPSFNTPDSLAEALTDLGVKVLTLANNHILDRGVTGASRTIDVLDSADIFWTGLSRGEIEPDEPLVLEYAGLRWAFASWSYGSNRVLASGDVRLNTISAEAVQRGLDRARLASPDILVACFHWGEEYRYVPTRSQREIAALCVENGVDLVIGTHPHVLQPIEIVSSGGKRHLVVWSLGNFVSYQRTLPRERSCVLAVDFEKLQDGGLVLSRVSVAPTRVSVTRREGRYLCEVVCGGESDRFNHAGLPASELKLLRKASRAVLDFLGASGEADEEGFYTLWDLRSPDVLPKGRIKSPL